MPGHKTLPLNFQIAGRLTVGATMILGHNECPEHSQCTNLFDGKGDILAGGYSCWCEEGYEYITHKIDLDTVDGSVTGSVPLRDRLVCNDIDECITLYPCNGRGLDSGQYCMRLMTVMQC